MQFYLPTTIFLLVKLFIELIVYLPIVLWDILVIYGFYFWKCLQFARNKIQYN